MGGIGILNGESHFFFVIPRAAPSHPLGGSPQVGCDENLDFFFFRSNKEVVGEVNGREVERGRWEGRR